VQVELSLDTYQHPLAVLAQHPETKRAAIEYAQLTGEPGRAVEKMYAELGFDVTPEFAAVLAAEDARARKHETSHRYSLAEFGLSPAVLRERLGALYAQFGWREPAEDA
jgi:hypothetical protein